MRSRPLLARGDAALNCVNADTTSPTVVISSDAVAPVTGPYSIAIAFSESVTGFELADLVVGNGSASALRGGSSSRLQSDDHACGLGGRDGRRRGRSRGGRRREPERRGRAVLDRRGPDPGADEPVTGAGGNPAEPDAGAGRHRGRGTCPGRSSTPTATSCPHGIVVGPGRRDRVRDRCLRDAGGGERACRHHPGDGDRPGRSERDAAVHGHGGVGIRAFHRPSDPVRSDPGQGRALHGAASTDRRPAKSDRPAAFRLPEAASAVGVLLSVRRCGFQENIFEPVQAFVAPRSSSAAMCSTTTPSPSSVTRRVPQR